MYTVYDCMNGNFPANYTVYTPYIHIYVWFWSTLNTVQSSACLRSGHPCVLASPPVNVWSPPVNVWGHKGALTSMAYAYIICASYCGYAWTHMHSWTSWSWPALHVCTYTHPPVNLGGHKWALADGVPSKCYFAQQHLRVSGGQLVTWVWGARGGGREVRTKCRQEQRSVTHTFRFVGLTLRL